jgi:CRISPR-associated protein Cas2
MERRIIVVTYDISCPKRWRKVFRCMKGFGEHLQLSVFCCDLTRQDILEMTATLKALIDGREDSVLIADLGVSAEGPRRIESLGKPRRAESRQARVF